MIPGKIITFYSYKGGVGRSMMLANVAWILASNGKRVLVIDWHIDAPGLHRYFGPFLIDRQLTESPGMMDFVTDYALQAATPATANSAIESSANILHYAVSIGWNFANSGGIDLVPAGRSGSSYSVAVSSFNWTHFYERLNGAALLNQAKERMREDYDYVLIDSQPGVSQVSGICTVDMPDVLVVCCGLNRQSVVSAAAVARSVEQQRQDNPCRIYPVLMRVDWAEKELLDNARLEATREFEPIMNHIRDRAEYWSDTEVPYTPYYSYVEVLAPFAESARSTTSILSSAERLTSYITDGEVNAAELPAEVERQLGLSAFLNDSRYNVMPSSLLNMSDIYFKAEDFEQAANLATQAIDLQPRNAYAYYQRATAYWYAGEFERAVADFTRELELEPGTVWALNGRGQCLAEMGEFKRAVEDLQQAIALAIEPSERLTMAYSRNGLGLAYAGLGQFDDALKSFSRSLKDAPNNAWLYFNRAQAYEWMKQLAKAQEDYRLALDKQDPPLPPWKRRRAQEKLNRRVTSK
jgi:tetratricopeptide (TPR) repeat protein